MSRRGSRGGSFLCSDASSPMIDSHAHLTDTRLADEIPEILGRARDLGVTAVITIGTQLEDSRAAVALARLHPEIFATVGIHPHSADTADSAALAEIRELADDPRVVAIGETGLDFHYDHAPREVQRAAFERQLELAYELGLPVVVHARDADDDVIEMLRNAPSEIRGVLHCFSSGRELLETGLDLGWYASFSGMITFSRYSDEDAALLRLVPLDRLLVETDSPYLAPAPYRGKRNEPCRVEAVARAAAELRGESFEELTAATTRNTRAFYRLPS
jgi:TatD DNase family protein